MGHLTVEDLKQEEKVLWNRVTELWECSMDHDFHTIDKAIHPQYVGWDNNSLLPHDRDLVIQSVKDHSVRLLKYHLAPLYVSVFNNQVGIANYRYHTEIQDSYKNIRAIKGRWTEIYLREENFWTLIAVHGGSEILKMVTAAKVYGPGNKH